MSKPNKILIHNDYAEIIVESSIYGLQKVKIDLDCIEKVKDKRVFVSNEGSKNILLYAEMYLKDGSNKKVRLHRYLVDCPKGKVVDHINFDTLDNRKQNLKICSNEYNCGKKDISKTYSNTNYKHISKNGNNYRITFYKGTSKKEMKRVFDAHAKTLEDAISIRDEYIKRSNKYATSV